MDRTVFTNLLIDRQSSQQALPEYEKVWCKCIADVSYLLLSMYDMKMYLLVSQINCHDLVPK